MKKLSFLFVFVLVSIITFIQLNGCSEDEIVNNPVVSTKGVFVLYEGVFGQATSYDYAFINKETDSVFSNVYQNSNNGLNLNAVPDCMQLYFSNLYIAAQGNFGQQGTIYKINPANNQLITSRNFGNNPYSFTFGNNVIYITNTASDYITVMDLNFTSIVDSISVGPNPSDIVTGNNNIFVAKQSYTSENSLAVVNQQNYQVNKIFFSAPPVSVEVIENTIYVSTYSYKKIYLLNSSNGEVIDSIPVQIPEPAIGSVCHGDSRTLFVLGVSDTIFSSNIGKRVYKLDLITKTLDPNFNIIYSGSDDAYGIAYDYIERRLYIANSKSGLANGEVKVYDDNGSLIKTYNDIGGKFPKRFAFKY